MTAWFKISFSRVIACLTGSVVAGEALALLVGMHILRKGPNPWVSIKNDLLLAIDIASGLGLIYITLSKSGLATGLWFWLLTVTIFLTHGYREWEFLAHIPNAFCANVPLFVVNTLKLCGIILAMTGMLIEHS